MNPLLIVEPDAEYRAAAADNLSSHALSEFTFSPRIYRLKDTGVIPPKDSAAFAFGRAAHTLTLEGEEAFADLYDVDDGPINPKTGKAYGVGTKKRDAWQETLTRPTITTDEHAKLCAMSAAVHSHQDADALLQEGQAEGVARETWAGVPCQIRVDWYSAATGMSDLKTCADLDGFAKDFRVFGNAYRRADGPLPAWRLNDTLAGKYCCQMAFYWKILAMATGEECAVNFIAVEKQFPYRVGVWELSQELLRDLAAYQERAIARWAECKRTDAWPDGYEGTRKLEAW